MDDNLTLGQWFCPIFDHKNTLGQWFCPIFDHKNIWATTWKNQQNGCAPSGDSDQPGYPPILIRVFAVRMKKAWVLSYPLSAQRRLWSDWASAQSDQSFRWAHTRFVGFVMSRLICRSAWPVFYGSGILTAVMSQIKKCKINKQLNKKHIHLTTIVTSPIDFLRLFKYKKENRHEIFTIAKLSNFQNV